MAKVDLIEDRCIGCGACISIAPDNFTFNDEGRAELINNKITDEAIEASETCPVSAIIIEKCNCGEECSYEECNCEEECTCEECNCSEECNCGDDCNCTEDNKCSENCNCNK